jgi:acetyl-CoA synthetase
MREGEDPVRRTSRRSLRILGTVGQTINPEAWLWCYDHVGEQRCPIVDTWWQTETGGILITCFRSHTVEAGSRHDPSASSRSSSTTTTM